MARASRIASSRKARGRDDNKNQETDSLILNSSAPSYSNVLYNSFDSRKSSTSIEELSCMDCLRAAKDHVYNLTVASCSCLKCRKRRQWVTDDDGLSEDTEVSEMRERLKFHFMNPFQKWCYDKRRRFPWKLIFQLLGIILLTAQLVTFASTRFTLSDFLTQNRRTFVNLFLIEPPEIDADDGTFPTTLKTIYTFDKLVEQINYTAAMYHQVESVATGPYGYTWDNWYNGTIIPDMFLVVRKHSNANIDPSKKKINISGPIVEHTYDIGDTTRNDLSTFINLTVLHDDLDSILSMEMTFNLSSIYIDGKREHCFLFNITMVITNSIQHGNMLVTMEVDSKVSDCAAKDAVQDINAGLYSSVGTVILDILVVLTSMISSVQYLRSLFKSFRFYREVRRFFRRRYDYYLRVSDSLPLFNLWFIGVVFANTLAVIGSAMKLIFSYKDITSVALVDWASITIGLAVFCQWCGLLRFLSYFDKYNILLLTLRLAMPSVLRFMLCTGILYIAFLLLGWLVLGPYHPKFRNPSITSECLFSLINGDDMYMTYKEMSQTSQAAWVFSKIYLYVFIALFIYVVLSVFISLISDTYETLHEQWSVRSRGMLQDFAAGQLGRRRTGSSASAMDSDSSDSGNTVEKEYEYLASQRKAVDKNHLPSPRLHPLHHHRHQHQLHHHHHHGSESESQSHSHSTFFPGGRHLVPELTTINLTESQNTSPEIARSTKRSAMMADAHHHQQQQHKHNEKKHKSHSVSD